MKIRFIEYLKDKVKKEKALQAAQLNITKKEYTPMFNVKS